MPFPTPTTQEEMVETLKEIFYHYRIKREPYDGVQLDPIVLERLTFTPLTEQQLRDKAQELLARKHLEERNDKIDKINLEQNQNLSILQTYPIAKDKKIQAILSSYDNSLEKIKAQAVESGIYGSKEYFNAITKLEVEKNQKLGEIEEEYELKTQELNSEIARYESKIQEANYSCDQYSELEILAKITELKEAQEEKEREVFKYNNGLEEKEQRYQNTIKQTNASLLIKFMSLRQGEFTQDELVDMGYYNDVIDCVCGYYNTLDPTVAAREIREDQDIIPYLDDYYQDILYMYVQRALA